MLKGREIRGLMVTAGRQKLLIGRVQDLVIDDKTGEVLGLVIEGLGVLQKNYFVKMENIKLLSKKGVFVPNKKNIKRLSENNITLNEHAWLGSKILSQKGEDKGTIADILVKNGVVAGLEVSSGLLEDLQKRRDFIPWQNVRQEGDVFIEGVFDNDMLT